MPTTSKITDRKSGDKILRGVVVSTKMKDTAVVQVRRFVKDPRYGKYLTMRKRYKVHDPGNKCAQGESVSIEECRSIIC